MSRSRALRAGTGATLLRLLTGATLLALIFPMGVWIGPFRVVTVDVLLLPLLLAAGAALAGGLPVPEWRGSEKGVVLLLVLMLASSVLSLDPETSLNVWGIWLRAGLFYFLLRIFLAAGVLDVGLLFRILVVLWAILIFVGLVQLTTGSDFGVLANYFGESTTERSTFGEIRRVSGTTSGSNVYGQWVVMLSLLVNGRLLLRRDGVGRLLVIALLVTLEVAVLLGTLSRANLGFFVVAHLLLVPYWIRSGTFGTATVKMYLVGAGAAVAAGVATYLYLSGGILATLALRIGHTGGRLLQIQHGFELLGRLKVLLLGTGMGTFYPTLSHLGIPITSQEAWLYLDTRVGIHHGPLLLTVEAGLAVGALFVWWTWDALKSSYVGTSRRRRGTLAGIDVAVWLTLLTFVLFPLQLYMSSVDYPMLFFLAMFYALAFQLAGGRPRVRGPGRRLPERLTPASPGVTPGAP